MPLGSIGNKVSSFCALFTFIGTGLTATSLSASTINTRNLRLWVDHFQLFEKSFTHFCADTIFSGFCKWQYILGICYHKFD